MNSVSGGTPPSLIGAGASHCPKSLQVVPVGHSLEDRQPPPLAPASLEKAPPPAPKSALLAPHAARLNKRIHRMPPDIASPVPRTFVRSHRDSVRESTLPPKSRDAHVVVSAWGSAPHAGYGVVDQGRRAEIACTT